MSMSIWVVAEQRNGQIKKVTHEMVGKAKELAAGGEVVAILIGSGISGAAAGLGAYGADRVLVIDDASLAGYSGEAYAAEAANLIKAGSPAAVFVGATTAGRELGPMLAAKLDAPYVADAVRAEAKDGQITVVHPVFAGKAFIEVGFAGAPAVVSVRPNAFGLPGSDAGKTAAVETKAFAGSTSKTKVAETLSGGGETVDLTEAEIIISGGRGMKGPEHFPLLEALAKNLGGTTGASRAAVDAGWQPHNKQVGQTGKVVSPNLYIACGISGSIQHMAGMSSSKCIVAINTDADAPIFKIADYGIVGDLFDVVPKLTELTHN
jgi:electron transfer flavoprotein alpha subunit